MLNLKQALQDLYPLSDNVKTAIIGTLVILFIIYLIWANIFAGIDRFQATYDPYYNWHRW